MPDRAETYCSPVIYRCKNGTEVVVFGTGGETHAGHLYAIQLAILYKGRIGEAIQLAFHSKTGKMVYYILCTGCPKKKNGTV